MAACTTGAGGWIELPRDWKLATTGAANALSSAASCAAVATGSLSETGAVDELHALRKRARPATPNAAPHTWERNDMYTSRGKSVRALGPFEL